MRKARFLPKTLKRTRRRERERNSRILSRSRPILKAKFLRKSRCRSQNEQLNQKIVFLRILYFLK
jgi:hypothetical protein